MLVTCVLVWAMLFCGFTNIIDVSKPAGTDDPSEADNNIRRTQAGWQELLNLTLYLPLTETEITDVDAGEVRQIPFHASISDPTPVATKSHLYMQNDELRYQDDTNSAFDLTSAGKLGSASTDLLGNDAVVTTLDISGTVVLVGTIDDDTMATATDTNISTSEAIKTYVDNEILPRTINASSDYVNLGNGLQIRWGNFNPDGATGTVVYGTAFTTDTLQVVVSLGENLINTQNPATFSMTDTGFGYRVSGESVDSVRYIAIGY